MIATRLFNDPSSQDTGIGLGEKCQMKHRLGRKERLNPVSDDDRVSVMASDKFDEAEEEAQPQEDYSSRIFNPEPVDKDGWEPHEAVVNYVN